MVVVVVVVVVGLVEKKHPYSMPKAKLIRSFLLIEHRLVTDRRTQTDTDRETDRETDAGPQLVPALARVKMAHLSAAVPEMVPRNC